MPVSSCFRAGRLFPTTTVLERQFLAKLRTLSRPPQNNLMNRFRSRLEFCARWMITCFVHRRRVVHPSNWCWPVPGCNLWMARVPVRNSNPACSKRRLGGACRPVLPRIGELSFNTKRYWAKDERKIEEKSRTRRQPRCPLSVLRTLRCIESSVSPASSSHFPIIPQCSRASLAVRMTVEDVFLFG
jgi:hypothetical protein